MTPYRRAVLYMQAAGMTRVLVELEDTEDHGYTDAHPQVIAVTYRTGKTATHANQKLAELVWQAAQEQYGPIVHSRAAEMTIPGAGVKLRYMGQAA